MLADAYKIASDIMKAMPVLSDNNLLLGKSKLKTYCLSFKTALRQLLNRIERFDADHLITHLASSNMHDILTAMAMLNKYILDVVTCIDVVIDNA